MNLASLWNATQPARHAIAGGVVAALTSAYAMGADKPVSDLSTHQWVGLAIVFATGAGLTKYVIPAATPSAPKPSAPIANSERGVLPDPGTATAQATPAKKTATKSTTTSRKA